MSRLIDADELKKIIPDTSADIFENCRNCKLLDAEQVKEIIDNAPTVEAEPVIHGHWELGIGYDPNRKFQCSECGKMAFEISSRCPKCGAKMDEVEE